MAARELIDAADFEALAALVEPKQREAARLVMVEGLGYAEAARRTGNSRQNVYAQVKRMDARALSFKTAQRPQRVSVWCLASSDFGSPPGISCRTVTLTGPRDLVADWQAQAVAAAALHKRAAGRPERKVRTS